MAFSDPYARIAQSIAEGCRLIRRVPLVGGVSARVDALEIALPDGSTRKVVVRQPGVTEYKHLADDVAATEFALVQALRAAGMPVPSPVLLDTSREVLPRPFYVMSFVDGSTRLEDGALPNALVHMASFLSRLHALELEAFSNVPLPPREDPVAGALEYLPSTPENQALLAALKRRGCLSTTNAPALLHGDFWPGNVLWKGGQIAAVIDWEDAAIGDPLCDLAGCRVELLWRYDEEALEAFTQRYLARANVDLRGLPYWELFVASAGLASMDRWGLEPEVEARMRSKAEAFIARASHDVLADSS